MLKLYLWCPSKDKFLSRDCNGSWHIQNHSVLIEEIQFVGKKARSTVEDIWKHVGVVEDLWF